jgi:hypothetical protein
VSELLETQKRYYAARAPEYDDWWYRRGRYAVDREAARAWNDDIAEVERARDMQTGSSRSMRIPRSWR